MTWVSLKGKTHRGQVKNGFFYRCLWSSPMCIGIVASSGCTCPRWRVWDLAIARLYGASGSDRYEMHRWIEQRRQGRT